MRPIVSYGRRAYSNWLRTPRWLALREDALARAGHQCEEVGCLRRDTLQVHHLSYRRSGGRERPTDLMVLCKDHHIARHRHKEET